MVNPMNNNWWEMPEFVRFTTKHEVNLWYNTIHHPEHLSIWKLPSQNLGVILQTLEPQVEELKPGDFSNYVAHGNWEKLNHFVNKQIANWYNKQSAREQEINKKTIIYIREI
jgi:hypothetical protein